MCDASFRSSQKVFYNESALLFLVHHRRLLVDLTSKSSVGSIHPNEREKAFLAGYQVLKIRISSLAELAHF